MTSRKTNPFRSARRLAVAAGWVLTVLVVVASFSGVGIVLVTDFGSTGILWTVLLAAGMIAVLYGFSVGILRFRDWWVNREKEWDSKGGRD